MAIQKQTAEFYGGVINRVFAIYPKNHAEYSDYSTLEFVKNRFNTVRNYREFSNNQPVEIREFKSDSAPRINTFKEGDVCLLFGYGRFLDKETYNFAKKCFSHRIPVFFIRANTLETDDRAVKNPIWKVNSLITQTATEKICHQPPDKYFMQIPFFSDLLVMECNDDLYALLPGMVPIS